MSPAAPPTLVFDCTVENIIELTDRIIEKQEAVYKQIASVETPTFENVIKPYGQLDNTIYEEMKKITMLQNVSTDKKLRQKSREADEKFKAAEIKNYTDEKLFKAIESVHNNKEEMAKLDNEDRRYVGKLVKEFVKAGQKLPEKLVSLTQELITLRTNAAKMLGHDTHAEYVLTDRMLKTPGQKEDASTWHKDVQVYEVWEAADRSVFVGHIYLDLFIRNYKFTNAVTMQLQPGYLDGKGDYKYPVAAMSANFDNPLPNKPSLLAHGDIIALFHELGHVFHILCSRTKWASFSGLNVERDFIEVPAQMMEHWAWEPSVLKKIALHYKSGKPIPDRVLNFIIDARSDDLESANSDTSAMATHGTSNDDHQD
ncbi:metalloendopeptidase [Coemansia sp. IMI 203386]|nr:metalloendopeptidase [Coemansia sp. IMI 203386]